MVAAVLCQCFVRGSAAAVVRPISFLSVRFAMCGSVVAAVKIKDTSVPILAIQIKETILK